MARFLDVAAMEGKPRAWMADKVIPTAFRAEIERQRYGGEAEEQPVWFAYNQDWPGVCLVVTRTDPPIVLTVITRQMLQKPGRPRANRTARLMKRTYQQRDDRRFNAATG